MTVHLNAKTRHLLTLTDPANLRPVQDPDRLDHGRPAQARQELADLLSQAVAAGLADRVGVERALLHGDAAARLQACRLVAQFIPSDSNASALDWMTVGASTN